MLKQPWYDEATIDELYAEEEKLEQQIAMEVMRNNILPQMKMHPRWTFEQIAGAL